MGIPYKLPILRYLRVSRPMAAKTKSKPKRTPKPAKRSGATAASSHKSTVSKKKGTRHVARKSAAKPAPKQAPMVSADNSKIRESQSKGASIQKSRTKDSSTAIHAYEA